MYKSYNIIFDKYQISNFFSMFEFQTQKILPILKIISDIASRIKQLGEVTKKPCRVRYEKDEINYLIDEITILSEHLKELNLKMSNITVNELLNILKTRTEFVVNESDVVSINEIQKRVIDELSLKKLFVLDDYKADYYNPKEFIFGQQVLTSCPSCEFNISEAGNCFALGRYTACVYHLMRSLEIPLKKFAEELQLNIADRPNWGNILNEIIKATEKLNDKSIKEEYCQITSYFSSVKTGWRNYVMHGSSKFTEEEAKSIFEVCKTLMQQLSLSFQEN